MAIYRLSTGLNNLNTSQEGYGGLLHVAGVLLIQGRSTLPFIHQVGCIAANMASNMFRNGTVVAAPAKALGVGKELY